MPMPAPASSPLIPLLLTCAIPAALLGLTPSARAADPAAPATASDVRQKLEMRRQELDAAKERAKFLQSGMAELKQEREKLNAKLLETAAQIQKSEARLSASETKLAAQEEQEKAIRDDLDKNSGRIAKLLAALQRMGRNPPPVLYTQRADALQMVRSAMLLAQAVPELRKDALELSGKLNSLADVTNKIRNERDVLKNENENLTEGRKEMLALVEAKKQALNDKQGELAAVRASAAELSKSVTDLNELIVKLDSAVTAGTGLGAYDAEARAKIADPATANTPPAAPGTQVAVLTPPPKPAPVRPSVVELAPAAMGLGAGASPGRMKPAIDFHLARARLPQPAQGRRVLAFGDKTQFGGQSKGIVIETRNGAQITSPCDGWIVYAGEFRSYGQLLIINAGGGYHVLLAGLSQIDAQPGQFVLAAEPVGTMSGSTARTASNPANAPVLYVEFRKDGRPIDPDPWWAEGQKKVQG